MFPSPVHLGIGWRDTLPIPVHQSTRARDWVPARAPWHKVEGKVPRREVDQLWAGGQVQRLSGVMHDVAFPLWPGCERRWALGAHAPTVALLR